MKKWLAVLGFLPGVVYGQESTELDAEFFKPTPGNSIFGVQEATLIPHMKLSLEALFHLAQNPVVATAEGQRSIEQTKIISTQMATDLMASVGVKNFIEFGVAIPLALSQSGDSQSIINAGTTISGSAVGDLRLSAKLKLSQRESFALAFAPELSVPTGDGVQLFGAKSTSALLAFAASIKSPKLTVSANAGPRFQESVEFLNLTLGRSIEGGVGAVYRVNDGIALLGEVNGAISLNELGVGQSPSEARAGARIKLGKTLWLPIGAGLGLTDGVGSPDFRVIAGLSVLPEPDTDTDLDGLFGDKDKCPAVAEDKDNFKDNDGCPEDNDQDGFADASDECVNTPGALRGCPDADKDLVADTKDACPNAAGAAELDGCPDSDNDTLADNKDQCPKESGSVEMMGCPDSDGDGLADNKDACPSNAGPKEQDGCPDSDEDGFADNKDQCADSPEDFDQFEDQDGCPDPDNDQDGIADNFDKCPRESEDGNGLLINDGCPSVSISGDNIILEKIYFDTGKASLQKQSYAVLDALVAVLKAHPEISKVEIQGHTDDQGDDKFNLGLSSRRAKRVMEYLVEQGIEPSRLGFKGYGETMPLVPVGEIKKSEQRQELRDAREKNRRVEFKIIN